MERDQHIKIMHVPFNYNVIVLYSTWNDDIMQVYMVHHLRIHLPHPLDEASSARNELDASDAPTIHLALKSLSDIELWHCQQSIRRIYEEE